MIKGKKSRCKNCPQIEKTWECVGDFARNPITREEMCNDIIETLKILYEKDKHLIKVKTNEVCISSHFYSYFERLFNKKYANLDIDPEYNRNGETAKYYKGHGGTKRSAKPDMIIHKRNCNHHNKIFIEFKPYWNNDLKNDYEKLAAFTNPYEEFSYKTITYCYKFEYGVSILLNEKNVHLNWIKDGASEPFLTETVDCEEWKIRS